MNRRRLEAIRQKRNAAIGQPELWGYDAPKTKRRGAPEKRVQRDVINALKTLGWWVVDFTMPRANMLPLGLPDLLAMHERLGAVWIEVKAPKRGKRPEQLLSDGQRGFHAALRAHGQRVVTVDSLASLLDALEIDR